MIGHVTSQNIYNLSPAFYHISEVFLLALHEFIHYVDQSVLLWGHVALSGLGD